MGMNTLKKAMGFKVSKIENDAFQQFDKPESNNTPFLFLDFLLATLTKSSSSSSFLAAFGLAEGLKNFRISYKTAKVAKACINS